jgi:hypothetical protein
MEVPACVLSDPISGSAEMGGLKRPRAAVDAAKLTDYYHLPGWRSEGVGGGRHESRHCRG